MSEDVEKLVLSTLESCFHFLAVLNWEVFTFKRFDGDLSDSSEELLGFIISWIVHENGVGSEDKSSNHLSEGWVLGFVSN